MNQDTWTIVGLVVTNVFLFLLVMGMASTVDIRNMRQQLRNFKAVSIGVFCQFILLPFLGYAVVEIFQLPPSVGITLIIVVSSPGGSYSNWWCSIMNADLALSVTMTTVSTILSMGFLPLNLYIYSYAAYHDVSTSTGQDVLATIDFGGIFLSLGIVIAAIGTGILCSWKIDTPHWHRIAYLGGNVSGIALIIWSTFLSFYPFDNSAPTPDEVVTDKHKIHYFAIMLPCILGLIAATCISTGIRLPKPERLTTAVECCFQNTGIATSAAFSLFSGDSEALSQAMRVPVIYGLVEAVAIGLYLVSFWKLGWSKAPKNERICTVITRSYELYEDKGEGDGHEVDYAQDEGENFEDNDDVGTEMARIASEKSGKESMEADVVS